MSSYDGYGGSEVSQAAAIALRQLQSELAAAHERITTLQDEHAALRADACQLAEAQHEAVLSAEHRCDQLAADSSQLRSLLTDMRSAVEALVQDNARLHAAAQPSLDLQAELQAAQDDLSATAQHLREEEARSVAAQQLAEASQAAASRQGAALDAAKRDAADAHAQSVQYKGSLEAVQCQLAARDADHARQLQERDERIEKLQRDVVTCRSRADRAEVRAADSQAAQKRAQDLEGKLAHERRQRERAESSGVVSARHVTAVLEDAASLHGTASQLAGHLRDGQDLESELCSGLGQSRGSEICSFIGHAEGMARRVCMLTELVTEALRELPGSRDAVPDADLTKDAFGPQHVKPWSVAAVHQGEGRNVARTLHPLMPSSDMPPSHRPASAAPSSVPSLRSAAASARSARPATRQSYLAATKASQARAASPRHRDDDSAPAQGMRRGRTRSARQGDVRPSSADRQQRREELEAVVVSLEDELSVLDQRYGDLLKTAHVLDADGDSSSESDLETQRESVAQATARILEAMQRKGAQIRQLRAHAEPGLPRLQ